MLVLLLALLSAIPLPAKPARYVTDNAGVLDAARAEALNEKLAQFERETSNQLLVYIDRDLPPDTTIEEMGSQAIHEWGVGQKGKDNGAILFLFTDARKMRIEVGYGLEEKLTDAKAKRITSTVIKPLLQQKDPTGAVEAGAAAMMETVRGLDFKGSGQTVAETGSTTELSDGCGIALIFGIVFGAIGIVVFAIVAKAKGWLKGGGASKSWGRSYSSDTGWTSSSSSDSSSSDSSDSSSDFSGGGGDGGGGGASDSW
jgi:uncharacterized protein